MEINISSYVLLAITMLATVKTDGSKPRLRCGPGTTKKLQNDSLAFVCDPCPAGTFSKGHNSVCRPCRRCNKHRVEMVGCTSRHNTVCVHRKGKGREARSIRNRGTSPGPNIASINMTAEDEKKGNALQEDSKHTGIVIGMIIFGSCLLIFPVFVYLMLQIKKWKRRIQHPKPLKPVSELDQKLMSTDSNPVSYINDKSITQNLVPKLTLTEDLLSLKQDINFSTVHQKNKITAPNSIVNNDSLNVIVQLSPHVHVNPNEYFPLPSAYLPVKKIKSDLENDKNKEGYMKPERQSVSSGCSDLSRHGQTVDSDEELCWCHSNASDESAYSPLHKLSSSDNITMTAAIYCPTKRGEDTATTQTQPVMSLDTVLPVYKESVLKPKESVMIDLQKPVQRSSHKDRQESHSKGHCTGYWNLEVSAEIKDDIFVDERSLFQIQKDTEVAGTQQDDVVSFQEHHVQEQQNLIQFEDETLAGKTPDGHIGEISFSHHTRSKCVPNGEYIKEESHDYVNIEKLNNWSCRLSIHTTQSPSDMKSQSESLSDSVFVSDALAKDEGSTSLDTDTCESASSDTSSDSEVSNSTHESTSSEPEPVTYCQIHNTYVIKDSNLTANTSVLAEASRPEVPNTDTDVFDPAYEVSTDVVEMQVETETSNILSEQSHDDTDDSNHNFQVSSNEVNGFVSTSSDVTKDSSKVTKETAPVITYNKRHPCKPENLHETLYKTEGTQTRNNSENMQTLFGQKFDVLKYFTSEGGQLTKSTTTMSLTVFENCSPEGEAVLVGGRFTGDCLDILPYLDEGWVVISPLAEFQMTYRKRWEKYVKIYLPYYPHDAKEMLRVFYYHRAESGDIEYGDVPLYDSSKNQDMYYVKKPNNVEIYTVTFTIFHCACDHQFPLFMTSHVFTSYNKNENEASVRLHIGDMLLKDPLVTKELKEKELDQHGTTLSMSKDLRLLQTITAHSDNKLVFSLDFLPQRSNGSFASNSQTFRKSSDAGWGNLFPLEYPQIQERRFCELVTCMDQRTAFVPGHSCRAEIDWIYASTLDPTPDMCSCLLSITHELSEGQEANRHGASQEGITYIRFKTSHSDAKAAEMAKETPEAVFGIPELPPD